VDFARGKIKQIIRNIQKTEHMKDQKNMYPRKTRHEKSRKIIYKISLKWAF